MNTTTNGGMEMGKTYKVRLSPTVIDTMSSGGDHFWGGSDFENTQEGAEWRAWLLVEFPDVASIFEEIVRKGGMYPAKAITVQADEPALRWMGIHSTWMESCGSDQPGWSRAGQALTKQLDEIATANDELADYKVWLRNERTPRYF